jgi:hypothetical protein
LEIIIAANKEMYVTRHYHITPDRDSELAACSGNIFLEASMHRFHVCDLKPANWADRYKEQGPIISLEDLVESRRAAFDHRRKKQSRPAATTPKPKSNSRASTDGYRSEALSSYGDNRLHAL